MKRKTHHRALILVVGCLVGCWLGQAQETNLPDAPSTSKPPAKVSWKDKRPTEISFKQAFKKKTFYVPYLIVWPISSIVDAEVTHQGLAHGHKGCLEGNPELPPRPSRKQLYLNDLYFEGGFTLFAWWLSTSGIHWIAVDTPAAVGIEEHIRGASSWKHCW